MSKEVEYSCFLGLSVTRAVAMATDEGEEHQGGYEFDNIGHQMQNNHVVRLVGGMVVVGRRDEDVQDNPHTDTAEAGSLVCLLV